MKIIKIITWVMLACIGAIALLLVIFEFYVWRMHDYAPNYSTIQTCIETGGSWDYDDKVCQR